MQFIGDPTPSERADRSVESLRETVIELIARTPRDEAPVVVDGSMYSPSTRAVDGAEAAWDSCNDDEWLEYEGDLEDAIERFEHEGWSLGWDEGMLRLYGPDYSEED